MAFQPKRIANFILYYDRARVSGAILANFSGRAFNLITTDPAADLWIASYSTLDANFGYKITSRTRLYIEGKNFTDSWYREVTGIHIDKVSTAIKDGPSFVLGATLNL